MFQEVAFLMKVNFLIKLKMKEKLHLCSLNTSMAENIIAQLDVLITQTIRFMSC